MADTKDPRAVMMAQLLTIASQVFCARAGERVAGENRVYDHADAVGDAAALMTMAMNASNAERVLAKTAAHLNLPCIWPSPTVADDGDEVPPSVN